jgi:hypothetical protein
MEKTKICEDCSRSFTYNAPENYPDRRKYCLECSAFRKTKWEAKTQPKESPENRQIDARNEAMDQKDDLRMDARTESIVAQVILKGSIELAAKFQFTDNERLGEYLCMCVNELTGAYKLALTNLKAL